MSLFKRRLQYIPILSNFHIFKKYVQQLRQTENWCLCTLSAITFDILMCAVHAPGNRSSSNLCFSYCGWETEWCCNTERDATKCSLLWRIRRRQVGMNGSVTDGWQSKANRRSRRDFSSIPTLPPTRVFLYWLAPSSQILTCCESESFSPESKSDTTIGPCVSMCSLYRVKDCRIISQYAGTSVIHKGHLRIGTSVHAFCVCV